jgi:hypothetical protein
MWQRPKTRHWRRCFGLNLGIALRQRGARLNLPAAFPGKEIAAK